MTKRKTILSTALVVVVLFALLSVWHFGSLMWAEARLMDRTAALLGLVPDQEQAIVTALKTPDVERMQKGYAALAQYGYEQGESYFLSGHDFAGGTLLAAIVAVCVGLAVLFARWREARRGQQRLAALTAYLGQVNRGDYRLRPGSREDLLSPLEDELYKTVVLLREGREQAAAARQSLADNLADIAHQLKTPLSSITLLADMLAGQEGAARPAAQIAAQAERMSGLVSALLTLSRVDAGTLAMRQEMVYVRELCQCAADAVGPLFVASGITLRLPRSEAAYTGDIEWSVQAVANILRNCVEHTPPGGAITVTCEENPIYTAITIEDNGQGIAPEDLPHLFERFYRGKHTKKESVGIGLALSKALIEAQNGTVTAENRPEGGARFLVKFYHPAVTEL